MHHADIVKRRLWSAALIALGCLFAPVALEWYTLRAAQSIERAAVFAAAPEWHMGMYTGLVQGDFEVEVTVAPSGEVTRAETVSTFWNQYDPLHERVAKRWRFEPSDSTTTHVVKFQYRYMPFETREEDLGTSFERPYTVTIRRYFPDKRAR